MNKNIRAIYVDCTETVLSRNNTGIQRNVTNIIYRSGLIAKKYDVNVIPVISFYGKLYKYNAGSNGNKFFSTNLSKICAYLRNILDGIFYEKHDIDRVKADPADSAVTISSHSKILEICRSVMPFIFIITYRLEGSVRDYRAIKTNDKDILLFADTFWNVSTFQSIQLYEHVCKIALIYDVIPLTTPEVCDNITVYMYNKHFKSMITNVDGIITISNSESKSVRSFLHTISEYPSIPVDYYYLGADFATDKHDGSKVRESVHAAMSADNVFLMVGTLEPRKNHAYVLDAFEELWRREDNVSLCIIGKVGWKCSDLLERIKTHDLLGKSLFYFSDANDEELAFCYERCRAVVFASIAEGFGLPLVEAMSYGRSVLVSDIPVFREIGEDYPVYFPLDDLDALVRCLYDFNRDVFTKRLPKRWISWDESVLNLFGKVLRMADGSNQSREAS